MAKPNKEYGYIYLTTNNVNGRQYIGKHSGDFNPNYLGSGKLIRQAIKKYGRKLFTKILIENCLNQDELNAAEIKWIAFYDAVNNPIFYNITYGGEGNLGHIHSEETRKKIQQTSAGSNNGMFGRKHTIEARTSMSEKQKNKPKRYGSTQKQRDALKRINEAKRGKPLSEAQLKHNREALQKARDNHKPAKKVIATRILDGVEEYYDSVTIAAKTCNPTGKLNGIYRCVQGYAKTAHRRTWKYE
jgi:group I intron endonuclease